METEEKELEAEQVKKDINLIIYTLLTVSLFMFSITLIWSMFR